MVLVDLQDEAVKVIRTFVAVLISEEIRERISSLLEQVKKLAPDVKWVAPENLHVTLKFLGNVEEGSLAEVYSAVEDAAKTCGPFDLSVSGLGAFPNPARARVVWVGLDDGAEELARLASALDANLARLGFEKEEKQFTAHITIGRVKTTKFGRQLADGIRSIEAAAVGKQKIASVAVMQSELNPSGPVYSPLRIVELS